MLAFATVACRSFNSIYIANNLLFDQTLYVIITNADKGSQKIPRTLFDTYLDQMLVKFEQNRMVLTI